MNRIRTLHVRGPQIMHRLQNLESHDPSERPYKMYWSEAILNYGVGLLA